MTPKPRLAAHGPATYQVPALMAGLAFTLVVAIDAVTPDRPAPAWVLGPIDELAHLATGLVAVGMLGRVVDGRLARGLIVASVAIDLDHVPQYLGSYWLTAGTARPYPHSLLTLAVVAALLWALRRWPGREGLAMTTLGVLIGLSIHFLRDLAEPGSGVALLWPLDRRTFSIPHSLYVELLAAGVAWSVAGRLADRFGFGLSRVHHWLRPRQRRALDSSTAR